MEPRLRMAGLQETHRTVVEFFGMVCMALRNKVR